VAPLPKISPFHRFTEEAQSDDAGSVTQKTPAKDVL
jgi:hypothetical protein